MKALFTLGLPLLLAGTLAASLAMAKGDKPKPHKPVGPCMPYAEKCLHCTDCSQCGHCAKKGGLCSQCKDKPERHL